MSVGLIPHRFPHPGPSPLSILPLLHRAGGLPTAWAWAQPASCLGQSPSHFPQAKARKETALSSSLILHTGKVKLVVLGSKLWEGETSGGKPWGWGVNESPGIQGPYLVPRCSLLDLNMTSFHAPRHPFPAPQVNKPWRKFLNKLRVLIPRAINKTRLNCPQGKRSRYFRIVKT